MGGARRTLLSFGLLAAAALVAFTIPASAEQRQITVRLVTGEVVTITVDVPPGTPLSEVEVPGVVENTPVEKAPPVPTPEPEPTSGGGKEQKKSSDKRTPRRRKHNFDDTLDAEPEAEEEAGAHRPDGRNPLRNPDGSPTRTNPGFFDALPGPLDRNRRPELRDPQVPRARSSCCRSTRPPASSTASAGRSSPRSTRSRPTTAAT